MSRTVTEAPADPTPGPGGTRGGDGDGESGGVALHRTRAWKRRRNAVRWFSVVTVAAVAGLVFLGFQGWDAARRVKGGASSEVITNPAAAGFVAAVGPSPVHLIALTDSKDDLSAFLVLVPNDTTGGSVIWSLGELVVEIDGEPTALNQVYASGGVSAARAEFEKVLGFGVTDVEVVGPDELQALAATVGAIDVSNPDPISVTQNKKKVVKFKSGALSLEPEQLNEFLTIRSVGEAPENRSTRTGIVIGELAERLAATEPSTPLGTELAALGAGDIDFMTLPTNRMSFEGSWLYSPDPEGIARELEGVVRFPVSSFPGQRPRVRVLNGTLDSTVANAVAPELARAGGEVLLVGNADAFDVATTTVVYSDESFKEIADRIAAIFGVSAERSDTSSDAADIDVVLGADYSR